MFMNLIKRRRAARTAHCFLAKDLRSCALARLRRFRRRFSFWRTHNAVYHPVRILWRIHSCVSLLFFPFPHYNKNARSKRAFLKGALHQNMILPASAAQIDTSKTGGAFHGFALTGRHFAFGSCPFCRITGTTQRRVSC